MKNVTQPPSQLLLLPSRHFVFIYRSLALIWYLAWPTEQKMGLSVGHHASCKFGDSLRSCSQNKTKNHRCHPSTSAVTAKYTMVVLADKETKAPKARLISKATADVSLTVSILMAWFADFNQFAHYSSQMQFVRSLFGWCLGDRPRPGTKGGNLAGQSIAVSEDSGTRSEPCLSSITQKLLIDLLTIPIQIVLPSISIRYTQMGGSNFQDSELWYEECSELELESLSTVLFFASKRMCGFKVAIEMNRGIGQWLLTCSPPQPQLPSLLLLLCNIVNDGQACLAVRSCNTASVLLNAELKLGSLSKQARWKQPNLLCVHEYNKQLKADD
jgi:hypothetical protein